MHYEAKDQDRVTHYEENIVMCEGWQEVVVHHSTDDSGEP
jgi:hypothetical protein